MEYRKVINLLINEPTLPSTFRIKNCVEINEQLHGMYNTNNKIKFKTTMLKSS